MFEFYEKNVLCIFGFLKTLKSCKKTPHIYIYIHIYMKKCVKMITMLVQGSGSLFKELSHMQDLV